MGKFKIGDRVRCIDDGGTDCVKSGQEYDVADVDGPYIYVREDGEEHGMYAYRFELVAPPLKIESGKFYRTRDGRKVGPMESDNWGDGYPWTDGERWYSGNGAWIESEESEHDLIAEWHDTPSSPVATQVDAIAEEYGPAPTRTLVKTGQGYGYELARFGDYVWVDTGKTAPITLRADKIAA